MEGNLIDPLEAGHILKFHYNLLDNSTSQSGKGSHGALVPQPPPSSPPPEMTTPPTSSPASENSAKIKQKKRSLKIKASTVTTSTQRRKLSIGNLLHRPSAQLNPANPINSIFKKQRAERERAHPIQSTASQSKPSAQLNPANPINPIIQSSKNREKSGRGPTQPNLPQINQNLLIPSMKRRTMWCLKQRHTSLSHLPQKILAKQKWQRRFLKSA